MIYFEKELQSKVLLLFDDSLDELGYLALGKQRVHQIFTAGFALFTGRQERKIWRKKK